MNARTLDERYRRAIRIGRIARRVLWAGTVVDFLSSALLAVSVHHVASAFFLAATVCFVAFDILVLAPMMREAREAIDSGRQKTARLDELFPNGRDV